MNTDTNIITEYSKALDGFGERLVFKIWADGTAEARLVDDQTGEVIWTQSKPDWRCTAEEWCNFTWECRRAFLGWLRKQGKA